MLNLGGKIKEIDNLMNENKKELQDLNLTYQILLQNNHDLQLEKEYYVSQLDI